MEQVQNRAGIARNTLMCLATAHHYVESYLVAANGVVQGCQNDIL